MPAQMVDHRAMANSARAALPVLHSQVARIATPTPAAAKLIALAVPLHLSNAAPAKPPPTLSAFDTEQKLSYGALMDRWSPTIAVAAKRYRVPATWIRAVMQVESGGRTMIAPGKPIVSSAGAMGLMQLMPETYERMRAQERLGRDPFDPHDNIFAGAAYLRALRAKYGYPTMFAAYNDGPGHLDQRLANAQLLPLETQNYLVSNTATLNGQHGHAENMARLTRPDGTPVAVDAAAVASVRAAFPGEYPPSVRSVIQIGRKAQGVRESVASAKAIIRRRGGAV
jgi:soluble lytic murein transglycosylase-like protein